MAVPSVLAGRVLRGDENGPGVPGLRVQVSVRADAGARVVARGVSDRKGAFKLSLPAGLTLGPESQFEVAFQDRSDAIIYRETEPPSPITSLIPASMLAAHLASPILLERFDGPLVDTDAILDGLSRVFENISPKGTPLHDRLMNGARCRLPSMGLSAHLYGDAFGVLNGDPRAARRFVEMLELVSVPSAPSRASERARPSPCGCNATSPSTARPAPRNGVNGEAIVPRDRALPVIAAAAYLQQARLFDVDLPGRALAVLCHIERLGKLFRLGIEGTYEPRALQQLRGILELGSPFPDRPREPQFPRPITECEPHQSCLEDALGAFQGVRGYAITAVSPTVACPGATITITGSGFGSTAGTVLFGAVEAVPTSWSDDTITVVVATGAGNPLSLELPPDNRLVCGRLIEATPVGRIDATFEIGTPEILTFFAGTRPQALFCVEPGDPIPITWRVRGASSVDVQVIDQKNAIVARSNPAPRSGVLVSLTAPATPTPLEWIARITASGVCPGPPATAEIDIRITKDRMPVDGMAITKAIRQCWRFLRSIPTFGAR